MQDVLTKAIEMHQAGQLGSAAQLYQKVLSQEQENLDALHLLGVLSHQRGDHARAVELMGRAVALRPNVPAIHSNLAEAYRALGQFERAAGCCHMALRLSANYPEALCNLGLAKQGLGRHAEAVEHFRGALVQRPGFAAAHSNLGISLRELGQMDEALSHFRQAVELDPDYAPAQTNLGQILIDRGRAEEALDHCQQAVRLQGDVAALHHNLGTALRAVGRLVEAKAAFLEAVRLDHKLAKSLAHLGLVLQQEGQLDEALTWLKQAVDLEPNDVQFWEHLAELHAEREEFSEAIPCWQRVLALEPQRASGHHGLGWALQEQSKTSEAREHFQTALRLQPDFAAALVCLGGLDEEQGQAAQAEEAFRQALRLQPAFALPHAQLATLLRGRLPDSDRAALEERLTDARLEDGPRARLLFALAHVLDACGEYSRAADCLRQANALSLGLKRHYVPLEHERYVDHLTAAFDADFFARTAGWGIDTCRPIFVFGLPRSGTTLIEQILSSHSSIHGAGELRLARQTFESIPAALGRSDGPLMCLPYLDAAAIRRLAEGHLDRLNSLDGGQAKRVVDKMPDNYLYLGLLAVLFPNAVFIHSRRDLRDVAVSCWMTDFRSIRWANDPEHIGSRFCQYRRLMEHWQAVVPAPVHEFAYERLVDNFETEARRLLAVCGLEWEPACARFHETARPVRTASVTQVRQPLYRHAVARWKHYETLVAELFAQIPVDCPVTR
jgi:tetratricopeptide (TPR) repeat protein